MTPTQINEANLAIAHFLGWLKPDKRHKIDYRINIPEDFWTYQEDEYGNESWFGDDGALHFHEKWDWIMLAWEKVTKYGTENRKDDTHFSVVMSEITSNACELSISHNYAPIYFRYQYPFHEPTLMVCVFRALSDLCQYWLDNGKP